MDFLKKLKEDTLELSYNSEGDKGCNYTWNYKAMEKTNWFTISFIIFRFYSIINIQNKRVDYFKSLVLYLRLWNNPLGSMRNWDKLYYLFN